MALPRKPIGSPLIEGYKIATIKDKFEEATG